MLYLEPNPQSNTIQIYGYNRQRQKVADYNGLWYTGDCYQIFPSSLNLFYKAWGSDESLNKPRWTGLNRVKIRNGLSHLLYENIIYSQTKTDDKLVLKYQLQPFK